MRKNEKGFTLIELLIVVAIIGIIVAIAIPNLLSAIQRAKQKRTMSDERTIGTALEAYAVDNNRYPPAAGYTATIGYGGATIGANVAKSLSPTFIKICPLVDGWSSWFEISTNGSLEYFLVSPGKDGVMTPPTVWGATTNFNDDICFYNGQFVSYPDGVQQ